MSMVHRTSARLYISDEVQDMVNDSVIKSVENVVATMAIENMCPSQDFIKELFKIATGEKTSEEVRQEVIREYARP